MPKGPVKAGKFTVRVSRRTRDVAGKLAERLSVSEKKTTNEALWAALDHWNHCPNVDAALRNPTDGHEATDGA